MTNGSKFKQDRRVFSPLKYTTNAFPVCSCAHLDWLTDSGPITFYDTSGLKIERVGFPFPFSLMLDLQSIQVIKQLFAPHPVYCLGQHYHLFHVL